MRFMVPLRSNGAATLARAAPGKQEGSPACGAAPGQESSIEPEAGTVAKMGLLVHHPLGKAVVGRIRHYVPLRPDNLQRVVEHHVRGRGLQWRSGGDRGADRSKLFADAYGAVAEFGAFNHAANGRWWSQRVEPLERPFGYAETFPELLLSCRTPHSQEKRR